MTLFKEVSSYDIVDVKSVRTSSGTSSNLDSGFVFVEKYLIFFNVYVIVESRSGEIPAKRALP